MIVRCGRWWPTTPCALVEAEERGLDDVLAAEFPVSDVDPFAVDGVDLLRHDDRAGRQPVDVDERIAEILARYPPDHVVHRSISRAAPILRAQAAEISAILETA